MQLFRAKHELSDAALTKRIGKIPFWVHSGIVSVTNCMPYSTSWIRFWESLITITIHHVCPGFSCGKYLSMFSPCHIGCGQTVDTVVFGAWMPWFRIPPIVIIHLLFSLKLADKTCLTTMIRCLVKGRGERRSMKDRRYMHTANMTTHYHDPLPFPGADSGQIKRWYSFIWFA